MDGYSLTEAIARSEGKMLQNDGPGLSMQADIGEILLISVNGNITFVV
jgi:hypothetical protein